MLELFYAPRTCALAPHLVLELIGAPYRATRLDFAAAQQRSPEYLALNPKGRVPALATARGVLTETPAILLYLAQCFPQAGLAPLDDPFALAQLQAFNSYLCSTVHVAHAHKVRGMRWADQASSHEDMRQKAPQNMADCFDLIDQQLLAGPWVMGEAFSVADAYLFTLSTWLSVHALPLARFARVATHHQRMLELPAVQRVMAVHAAA